MSFLVRFEPREISPAARTVLAGEGAGSRSGTAMPGRTSLLHQRLLVCARQARAVDVRPFELQPASEALRGLVPPVVQVLEVAIGVCRDVLSAFDPLDGPGADELDVAFDAPSEDAGRTTGVFQVQVDAILERPSEERRIADVAFLGISELRPKLGRIERMRALEDPWEIVAECGSALRRVEKSLTAIEVVLCQVSNLPAQLSFASQLSRSLEVRQQYARLRSTVSGLEVSDTTQHRALRLVGTAIAMLVGKDVYPDLRIHDRRQLRALQERILAWLREDGSASDHVPEGRRLWQDIVGFADLLAQVSRRQELVEHDARVISLALDRIRAGTSAWPDDTLDCLRALRGLDEEIDALLDRGETSAARWAPAVRRLHRTLCDSANVHALGESGGHEP